MLRDTAMLTASANAAPQTAVVIDEFVFYASNNVLIEWQLNTQDLRAVATVPSEITCVIQSPHKIYLSCTTGEVYEYEEKKLTLVTKTNTQITSLAWFNDHLAIGSMDGQVLVLTESKEQKFGVKGYPLCLAGAENLLFIGGTKCKITCVDLNDESQVDLEGHENWVRSLTIKQNPDNSYSLASASQDRYIRLWKISKDESKEDYFSTRIDLNGHKLQFEALLMGHDDWVVAVQWDKFSDALLSASLDSSMIVWLAGDSDLWTPANRFGDLSIWGASTATGTSGGFWNCLWAKDSLLTTTKTGSFRVYSRETGDALPGPTGHFKEVTDCCWLTNELLLTTSLDQTTRLWHVSNSICEIGRPQIHGYDMLCIVKLDDHHFISAGDEKVVRVFEMPKPVAHQIANLGIKLSGNEQNLPEVAGVPALGLSNKPETDEIVDLPANPREDYLQRFTLWPEIEKLYAHGYEINSIAYANGVVASVCRANSEQHAKIRYFSSENWHEIPEPTPGHSLTVTKLSLNADGTLLLSVSRDRMFMVTNLQTHEPVIVKPKAHSRIIWDGCFFNNLILTGSRDKTVRVWEANGELVRDLKFDWPVTSLASTSTEFAVGLENGDIFIYSSEFEQLNSFKTFGKVNSLELRGNKLAACSTAVEVFTF